MLLPGISHMIGDFALQVYALAESKETNERLYNRNITYGVVTLLLVYFPGFVRVVLLARKRDWAKMTAYQRFEQVLKYALLVLIWPVFSTLL